MKLVRHLADAGPALLDELVDELALDPRQLRALRRPLERVGAILGRGVRLETASGGGRQTTELARWDQRFPVAPAGPGGLEELVVAGVRAAVVTPEREARRWFSWPVTRELLDRLVDDGRLVRPEPGWLAAP